MTIVKSLAKLGIIAALCFGFGSTAAYAWPVYVGVGGWGFPYYGHPYYGYGAYHGGYGGYNTNYHYHYVYNYNINGQHYHYVYNYNYHYHW